MIRERLVQLRKENDLLDVRFDINNEDKRFTFSIRSKREPSIRFFVTVLNNNQCMLTYVPNAEVNPVVRTTEIEQFDRIEDLLEWVMDYFEDRGIMTDSPNSVKFIMSLE